MVPEVPVKLDAPQPVNLTRNTMNLTHLRKQPFPFQNVILIYIGIELKHIIQSRCPISFTFDRNVYSEELEYKYHSQNLLIFFKHMLLFAVVECFLRYDDTICTTLSRPRKHKYLYKPNSRFDELFVTVVSLIISRNSYWITFHLFAIIILGFIYQSGSAICFLPCIFIFQTFCIGYKCIHVHHLRLTNVNKAITYLLTYFRHRLL